jgi:hypothetical protein
MLTRLDDSCNTGYAYKGTNVVHGNKSGMPVKHEQCSRAFQKFFPPTGNNPLKYKPVAHISSSSTGRKRKFTGNESGNKITIGICAIGL